MSKKENIDNPTPEQVEQWKKDHGDVFLLEVAENPETFEPGIVPVELDQMPRIAGYIKKPDRQTMNFALATMSRDSIRAGKSIVRNAWLGGDMRLMNDENYSVAASMEAISLVDMYQSRIKKL